jgi:hypothetical protein
MSIQGLLGVCMVVLGSALALAGCNHDDECAEDCSVQGTYPSYSGNGGGGNLIGDEPGQACIISADLCEWSPITAESDAASLSNSCMSQEGDVATDCPTKDLGGCCADHNSIECHYNVVQVIDIHACAGRRGTWRPTPP